ncbi:MAG: hypothetical protein BMS9Abin05_1599 [Rhodothermia bacterium]|nr:MAG: hypothetical protein BMS9Abin05_1599 [Rhodothermia bacterium]
MGDVRPSSGEQGQEIKILNGCENPTFTLYAAKLRFTQNDSVPADVVR